MLFCFYCYLLTYFIHCSGVLIVDFEQLILEWVTDYVREDLTLETDLIRNER